MGYQKGADHIMIQALELNDMVNIRGGHSQGCEQIEKRQGSIK